MAILRGMKSFVATISTAVLLVCSSSFAALPPNILFIAIDDLNDWVGCLGGHPQAKTPHMDRLARRGTLFTNAHCKIGRAHV